MDTTESEPNIREWFRHGVLIEKGREGSSRNQSVGWNRNKGCGQEPGIAR